MKFVLRINGVQGAYNVKDLHGGRQGETVTWKVTNNTQNDFEHVTFEKKDGFDFPFDSVSTIPKLGKGGKTKLIQADVSDINDGTYKFNLVADPNKTVIGADPDIEVAGDLGFPPLRKATRATLTVGKSKHLKSRKSTIKKQTQKSAKASKRKKTVKRK